MTLQRLILDGEVFISLEDTATYFSLEITELQTWISEDLVTRPQKVQGRQAFPITELDRIAKLVRLTRLLGADVLFVDLLLRRRR